MLGRCRYDSDHGWLNRLRDGASRTGLRSSTKVLGGKRRKCHLSYQLLFPSFFGDALLAREGTVIRGAREQRLTPKETKPTRSLSEWHSTHLEVVSRWLLACDGRKELGTVRIPKTYVDRQEQVNLRGKPSGDIPLEVEEQRTSSELCIYLVSCLHSSFSLLWLPVGVGRRSRKRVAQLTGVGQ